MKALKVCLLLFLVSFTLSAGQTARLGRILGKTYSAMGEDERRVVLVTFADKGVASAERLAAAPNLVSERSLQRRLKMRAPSELLDEADLPLDRAYVNSVRRTGAAVRHELKWFNAVSAVATKRQIEALLRLPFVTEVELVGRWRKRADDEQPQPFKASESLPAPSGATSLDYGTSFTQNNQIGVPAVHDLGIYGQGVVVGVFDNGFRNPAHVAFDSMHIIAEYDFVDHKVSVVPLAPSPSFGSHGVMTLSTIGGYAPGQIIGPAFKASYILARTESDSSETPVEEDNWAKAIEWADSLGIDVASTSLGYLTYDAPYPSWTWADMDGSTMLITRAADRASSLGIVVVNSAGNSGGGDGIHNTLIAPADGVNVIAAGAVNSSGTRTAFSSVGPTTDVPARIKPDIMAMGSGVKAASSTDTLAYVSVAGTSFSCPLSAGVAALILCANPSLTPYEVREAMRNTASNAGSPNNQYGWGILNAFAAVNYYGILTLPHISGRVFHDVNGDSIRNYGEAMLPGITVHLTGPSVDSTVTDDLGNFTFESLTTGNYNVSVDVPAGWVQQVPVGPVAATVDSLPSNVEGVQFGLLKLCSLTGSAFRDVNFNQVRDPGEPGLAGVVFHLDGPPSLRAVTDSSGVFTFTGLFPGTYVLSESTQAAWVPTISALPETVTVLSGVDTAGFAYGVYVPGDYFVHEKWNLLSLPQNPPNHAVDVLYPSAQSPAFGYGPGYRVLNEVSAGEGFWIKFDTAEVVSFGGNPVLADTVVLVPGWNLVGTIGLTIAAGAVEQQPPALLTSGFFGFDGAQYLPADSLYPNRGYWVKSGAFGSITLASGGSARNTSISSAGATVVSPLGVLALRDNAGEERRLVVNDGTLPETGAFELPPPPPQGVFDVRFESQRSAETLSPEGGEFPVAVSSAVYPLMVRWTAPEGMSAVLRTEGASYDLSSGKDIAIPRIAGSALLAVRRAGNASVPEAFALKQNFPNPFNPTTTIAYDVAAPSHISLKVFSLLGELIATLADEDLPAGAYRSTWNAEGAPSGVYYCVFRAGSFSAVQKMILLK